MGSVPRRAAARRARRVLHLRASAPACIRALPASIAAALLATSPIFLFQLVQPMSDVPAPPGGRSRCCSRFSPYRGAAVAAGATAGLACSRARTCCRSSLALAVFVCGWPTLATAAAPRSLVAFAAGLVPAVGALALLQWRLYGSPLASGLRRVQRLLCASRTSWPNIRAYSRRLASRRDAGARAWRRVDGRRSGRPPQPGRRGATVRSRRVAIGAAALVGAAVAASATCRTACSPSGPTCGSSFPRSRSRSCSWARSPPTRRDGLPAAGSRDCAC